MGQQARYEINFKCNGVEIYFFKRPENYLLNEMKQTGWRWHGQKCCWYTYNTAAHREQAKRLCQICNSSVCDRKKKQQKRRENDIMMWNAESALRKCGYSVSQTEGLISQERWRILEHVVENKILTPRQIVYHIETQIALREKNDKYEYACHKWRDDVRYVKEQYAC